MADFNIRSDSVDVEQIMRQIRARIREKRGVDYTEQQIRELAAVKLERFLDPQKVRSELLQQFREGGIAPLPNYAFEDTTLFESHRAPLRWVRRLLHPILKLFFNPNPMIHVLHLQADINTRHAQYTELSYEILHNLVLEVTRLGIEVKNQKMRVESLSSRLDFNERRARSLEGVVQYRQGEAPEDESAAPAPPGSPARREGDQQQPAEQRRRRRRRRGRRGGPGRAEGPEGEPESGATDAGGGAGADGGDDQADDAQGGGQAPGAQSPPSPATDPEGGQEGQ
jgi:hypothetical protein